MLRRIYAALPIRLVRRSAQVSPESVWKHIQEEVRATDAAIPRTELTEHHIAHLRVVIDRAAMLKLMPKGAVVGEIGVAEGEFSAQILQITEPQELHLVDSWSHDPRYLNLQEQVAAKFARQIADGQVVLHQGLSTTELAKFPDAFFDWVYLDTSHDYASTREELALCRAKVKPGGIIAGHDYVTGAWLGQVRYGVVEALHELCVQYNWELLYLTHESHRHLSFAVRQIGAA